jgi:alpha-mannosidase
MNKSVRNSSVLDAIFSRCGKAAFAMLTLLLLFLFFQGAAAAQSQDAAAQPKRAAVAKSKEPALPAATKAARPDLTKQPTLYVVSYAHLDTQWRWEYPQVIREYLTKTMRDNFALFEKYPHYIFNFSGANRYRMMKEYFPSDYARLKQYVAAGRWFPAGSSVEEGDVNSPSAESIIRQILYGNQFFRREFGKASAEYMLPDCFGFPASLPSILAHMGLKGFSTQKLTWGSAAPVGGPGSPENTPLGTPFNVGIWEGPDGKSVIAAFNPGSYGSRVYSDLSKSNSPPPNASDRNYVWDWPKRVDVNGNVSGVYADYHYIGTGDTGGAPTEDSVRMMEAITTKSVTVVPPTPLSNPAGQPQPTPQPNPPAQVGDGSLRVINATADQMFHDIKPEQMARLPRFKGELQLTNHSAGSYSSQTYQKRWNRKNELLADAAERASVAAAWLGGRSYPLARLNNAWTLVMGGQFHDILPGTATPKSFQFSWNDDVIAMNQFAGVLTSATEAIASGMNTQSQGTPVVVYNPLNIAREDVVEAAITFPDGTPKGVRVIGPDGQEVPAQLSDGKVLFLARVPSVGYAVYDIQAAATAGPSQELIVSVERISKAKNWTIENLRYRVSVREDGDVSSLFDKSLNKELLSAPVRLAIRTDKPEQWPAWNMDWPDQQKPTRTYVAGPAKIRIMENGPARVALEIEREAEGSKFVQTIRLSAGDAGNRVEFSNVIDWNTREANLKATFPLAAANPMATYNWDIGTIERANNNEKKFEVPSHQWFDLTDKSGAFGVTVLTDCKNASDKPDDNTLRLTLFRTPGLGERAGYADQTTQDLGHHEFVFGLAGHAGDWRLAETDWQAQRLNQPLIAFESPKHSGALGKSFSLLRTSISRVRVLALKKAEASDEVIVRLVELDGKPAQNVRIAFAAPLAAAREVNGQELPLGTAAVSKGELVASFTPYQIHTFAVKLAAATAKVAAPQSRLVTLPYDRSIASRDARPADGNFDAQGRAYPAEMLPAKIDFAGVRFNLAPAGSGKLNSVISRGQTIALPPGKFTRIYVLAAAVNGDQKAAFRIGEKPAELTIQDWTGFIGQWDDRIWKSREEPIPLRAGAPAPPPGTPPRMRVIEYGEMVGLKPGFTKRADVAWYASHRHASDGSAEPYAYSYLFVYAFDLPPNAKSMTLPDNANVRILAVTVTHEGAQVRPAQPLYDTLERTNR